MMETVVKFFQLDENQSCSAEERKVEAERSFSAPRDVDLRRAPTVGKKIPRGIWYVIHICYIVAAMYSF